MYICQRNEMLYYTLYIMDEGVHGGNIMTNYNKPAFLIAVDACVLPFMHIIYIYCIHVVCQK